jgi:hypothetical protein
MADDPELKAMSAIKAALEPLDEETRRHVLRWAVQRFDVELPVGNDQPSDGQASAGRGDPGRGAGKRLADFSDVASLVGAANPKTDQDRALIVATWIQVVGGNATLGSQAVNTELKNLGYGVANITTAFNRLMNQSPKLALQVQKSGRSQQARKQYKVTDAGIRRVEALIAGTASSDEE